MGVVYLQWKGYLSLYMIVVFVSGDFPDWIHSFVRSPSSPRSPGRQQHDVRGVSRRVWILLL